MRTLQEQLMKMDDSNEWELVFDKTTINATNGLRLPYNDKASKVPIEDPAGFWEMRTNRRARKFGAAKAFVV